MNFTKKALFALKKAKQIAKEMKFPYVGTEHLLLAMMSDQNGIVSNLLKKYQIQYEEIFNTILNCQSAEMEDEMEREYSPKLENVLLDAKTIAKYAGMEAVGTEHILLAMLRSEDCVARRLLVAQNVNIGRLYKDIIEMTGNTALDAKMRENAKNGKESVIKKYCRDLTELAKQGKLDPVVGREKEISRVIQILSRRTKNNPCLIGEAGVGKTAIAEALAERIAEGKVPESMKNKKLLMTDITGMVAGTKYRGEFEERMKSLIDEVSADPDILLFIDELHTLIGAGDAEGALDAANIIKPPLARGEMQILGATTVQEYKKHIEKDPALERRFQPVLVEEPGVLLCMEILKGIRPVYEEHHKVEITDDAVKAAAELSARYISDRFLPDKAIDLMDEAASKVRLDHSDSQEENALIQKEEELSKEKEEAVLNGDFVLAQEINAKQNEIREVLNKKKRKKRNTQKLVVDENDIAVVVSDWTGIPVATLGEKEMERLKKLEETLHKRVVGQDEAIKAVSKAVRRGRVGLKDPKRPTGSFLFLGPTGVGKTEISKALSEAVFGSEKAIIRVDMSEYMEKHSVSKIIGAPPGYVGFEEGGQLSEKVRKHPYSVILFDEIEKAHPDVFNILLQILDDGQVTDSQGRKIDFKNTIIIMTSNCGASNIISPKHLGFGAKETANGQHEFMKNRVMEEVKKTFRPEFLNRIDEIIVFRSLEKSQMTEIAEILVDQLKKRVAEQMQLELTFSKESIEFLAEKGYDIKYGARPIRRAIQTEAEDRLADALLEGRIGKGQKIQVIKTEKGLDFIPEN